jgi:hypothetical protein
VALEDRVARLVAKKIGWEQSARGEDVRRFMRDFHAAQRGFSDRRKNLGDERIDKTHRKAGG